MIRRLFLVIPFLCLVSTVAAQSPPVIVYPAGAYTVTTPGPTTITYTATSVTFSWVVPPAPTPPPAPVPTPPPVLTGHVWALSIYDATKILPIAQEQALASAKLKTSALLEDVDFQPFKSTDASVASWLPHLPASGLPALLFIQKDAVSGKGELAYAVALPGSEADILSLINKVRGK